MAGTSEQQELDSLLKKIGCDNARLLPEKLAELQETASKLKGMPALENALAPTIGAAERALELHQRLSLTPSLAEQLKEVKHKVEEALKETGISSPEELPRTIEELKGQLAMLQTMPAVRVKVESVMQQATEALNLFHFMRNRMVEDIVTGTGITFESLILTADIGSDNPVEHLQTLLAEHRQPSHDGGQDVRMERVEAAEAALEAHRRTLKLFDAAPSARAMAPQPPNKTSEINTSAADEASRPSAKNERRAGEIQLQPAVVPTVPMPEVSPPAVHSTTRQQGHAPGKAIEGPVSTGTDENSSRLFQHGGTALQPHALAGQPVPEASLSKPPSHAMMQSTLASNEDSRAQVLPDVTATMPPCAEKSLILLTDHFRSLGADHQMLDEEGLRRVYSALRQQLENEEFSGDVHQEELPTLDDILQDHRECVLDQTGDECESYFQLEVALKRLRPINMDALLTNARLTQESASVLEGQDVILLLGGTGTGKSTTIQFLAGSNMERTEEGHIQAAANENQNPALAKVVSSFSVQSETRYITAVPVAFADLGLSRPGGVTLCDTPGFEDTSGPEVDIPNGIGIVTAAKKCRSVRPVALLSSKSIGDRSEGLLKSLQTLTDLLADLPRHVKSISFLLTKGQTVRDTLARTKKAIHLNLTKEMKAVVTELKRQCKPVEGPVLVKEVWPVEEAAGPLLKFLADRPAIELPQAAFRQFFGHDSTVKLDKQVTMHEKVILRAIKRRDLQLLQYKLLEMKQLSSFLAMDKVTRVYDNAVQHLARDVQKEMLVASQALTHQLDDNNTAVSAQVEASIWDIVRLSRQGRILQDHKESLQTNLSTDFESRCQIIVKRKQGDFLKRIRSIVESPIGLNDCSFVACLAKMGAVAGKPVEACIPASVTAVIVFVDGARALGGPLR